MSDSRWAMVTGAARGLGRAIAERLAQDGYNLILHARDRKKLEQAAQSFSGGGEAVLIDGDLTDPAVIAKLAKEAENRGIECLVNNAGAACPGLPLEEIKSGQIEELISVNFATPIVLSRAVYPSLKKRKSGTIININSIVGIEEKRFRTIYSAVRFGLRGFTRSLAIEAAESGVRVIGVHPTRIKSRPEYEYGFEIPEVVDRIWSYWKNGDGCELILDGRKEGK